MNIQCDACSEVFDFRERAPMLMSCGHNLCRSCALDCKECPLDKTPCSKNSATKNNKIIQLLEELGFENEESSPTLSMKCPSHKEKLNMICLNDMREICWKCFRETHKGHFVKEFREFKDELNDIKSSFKEIESLISTNNHFNHATEKKELMKLMLEEKEIVKRKIKEERNEIYKIVYECADKILAQVDKIFAINERIIEYHLKDKQALMDANKDVLPKLKENLDYFRDFSNIKLNKECIGKIIEHQTVAANAYIFQDQLQEMQNTFNSSPIASHLSDKILRRLKGSPLFSSKLLSKVFEGFDLLDSSLDQGKYTIANRVQVGNLTLCLKERDIQFLANSIAEPAQYTISRNTTKGQESFIVDFKTREQSAYFVLFDGMWVNENRLKVNFVETGLKSDSKQEHGHGANPDVNKAQEASLGDVEQQVADTIRGLFKSGSGNLNRTEGEDKNS